MWGKGAEMLTWCSTGDSWMKSKLPCVWRFLRALEKCERSCCLQSGHHAQRSTLAPLLILCFYLLAFEYHWPPLFSECSVINHTEPLNPWVIFRYDFSSSVVWSTCVLSAHLEQIWEVVWSAGMKTGLGGRRWWNLVLAHEADWSKLLYLSVSFFSPLQGKGEGRFPTCLPGRVLGRIVN